MESIGFSELIKSPAFKDAVKEQFPIIYEQRDTLLFQLDRIYYYCADCWQSNFDRWGYPIVSETLGNEHWYYRQLLTHNLEWMRRKIEEMSSGIESHKALSPENRVYYNLAGQRVQKPARPGIYISPGGKIFRPR